MATAEKNRRPGARSPGQDAASPAADREPPAPGEEPAEAPSLWPGTQASFDAGYQWLEVPQS